MRQQGLLFLFILIRGLGESAWAVEWAAPVSGVWSDPSKWIGGQVPGASDVASIVADGSYTVTLDEDAEIANLVLGASTGRQNLVLDISNSLILSSTGIVGNKGRLILKRNSILDLAQSMVVSGSFTWEGGTIKGPTLPNAPEKPTQGGAEMVLGPQSETRITGPDAKTTEWFNFEFQGNAVVNSSQPIVATANVIKVTSTANFSIRGTAAIVWSGSIKPPEILNNGTITVDPGAGLTVTMQRVIYNNYGLTDIHTGNYVLIGPTSLPMGECTGEFHTETGTTLSFGGGNYTFNSRTSFTGFGAVIVSSGSHQFAASTNISRFEQQGGAVQVLLTLNTSTSYAFLAGTLAGPGTITIPNGASFIIRGTGSKTMSDGVLDVGGLLEWFDANADVRMTNGYSVNIQPSGEFHIYNCADFTGDFNNPSVIDNFGEVIKETFSGKPGILDPCPSNLNNVVLNNHGTVTVNEGDLSVSALQGQGMSTGTYNILDTATFTFANTTHQLLDGVNVIGNGYMQISGSNIILPSGTVTINNLRQTIGTLEGAGDLVINNLYDFQRGNMNGPGRTKIPILRELRISGSIFKEMNGRYVENSGLLIILDTLNLRGDAVIENTTDGTIAIETGARDESITGLGSVPAGAIVNSGTFVKSGTGTFNIASVSLDNLKLVRVEAGLLQVASGGDAINAGPLFINDTATLAMGSSRFTFDTGTTLTGGGTVEVNSGIMDVNLDLDFTTLRMISGLINAASNLLSASSFNWSGGTLTGDRDTPFVVRLNWDIDGNREKRLRDYGIRLDGAGFAGGTGAIVLERADFILSPSAQYQINPSAFWGGILGRFINNGFVENSQPGTREMTGITFENYGVWNMKDWNIGQPDLRGGGVFNNRPGGVLQGTGSFTDLNNYGTIKVGPITGFGDLRVAGDYLQEVPPPPFEPADLELDLDAVQNMVDRLLVGNKATLGGRLTLNLTQTPPAGVDYSVMTYGSHTDEFDEINSNPILPAHLGWKSTYLPNELLVGAYTPDLAITKSASPTVLLVGNNVEFEVRIRNAGVAPATNVTLRDVLPPSLQLVTILTGDFQCQPVSGAISCTLNEPIDPGGERVLYFIANAKAPDPAATNVASVTATQSELITFNNSDDAVVSILSDFDDPFIMGVNPLPVVQGGVRRLSIAGGNFDPSPTVKLVCADMKEATATVISSDTEFIVADFDVVSASCIGGATITVINVGGGIAIFRIIIVPAIILVHTDWIGRRVYGISDTGSFASGTRLVFFPFGNTDGYVWIRLIRPFPESVRMALGDTYIFYDSLNDTNPVVDLILTVAMYQQLSLYTRWAVSSSIICIPPGVRVKPGNGPEPPACPEDKITFGKEEPLKVDQIEGLTEDELKQAFLEGLKRTQCNNIGQDISSSSAPLSLSHLLDSLERGLEASGPIFRPEDLLETVAEDLISGSSVPFNLRAFGEKIQDCTPETEFRQGWEETLTQKNTTSCNRPIEEIQAEIARIQEEIATSRANLQVQRDAAKRLQDILCIEEFRLNTRQFPATFRWPYDPNDKDANNVLPSRLAFVNDVTRCVRYLMPVRTPIEYVITFENKAQATAPATNVTITDVIDSDLDLSTFEVINASHIDSATWTIVDNTVTFKFENINLPPNKNPPEGEGFIMYRIRPKIDLPIGTEIRNQASIVFDFNPPIITGEVVHVLTPPDFNDDGVVDAGDLLILIESLEENNGESDVGSANVLSQIDLNGDGFVDHGELMLFQPWWEEDLNPSGP